MISLALMLAAHPYTLVKSWPGWGLYRYESGCALRTYFGASGVMQIASDAGANRVFFDIRDPRFASVERGRSYQIMPVPVRDGVADSRYKPVAARGVADAYTRGYVLSLKGDSILGAMAKSEKVSFAFAGGESIMSLGYQPIGPQVRDLKQCADQVLRARIGYNDFSGSSFFPAAPLIYAPR